MEKYALTITIEGERSDEPARWGTQKRSFVYTDEGTDFKDAAANALLRLSDDLRD